MNRTINTGLLYAFTVRTGQPFVLLSFQGHPKEPAILLGTNIRKKYVGETWRGHYAVVIIHEDSGNGTVVVWSAL